MGEALNVALDLIEERKTYLKGNGVQYYRPQLVLLTDGYPTDFERMKEATARIAKMEDEKGVIVFAVGVEGADKGILDTISSKRQGLMIKDMNFSAFFQWLSQSAASVSASQPDADKISIPPVSDWADV